MVTPEAPSLPPAADAFLARALASRDMARESGRYVPATEVIASLEAQLFEAKSKHA